MLLAAYLSSVLTSMTLKATLVDERVSEKMAEVREFFLARSIPAPLQNKVVLILQKAFEEDAFDEKQILEQLPVNLQS